jgi:lipopolysaccharide/colanic/teichoic acid biosynthesis glycosyltransferase
LAAAALVLLLPFLLLIPLPIPLTSPGPAIFRQERCGLNERRFDPCLTGLGRFLRKFSIAEWRNCGMC